SVESPAFRLARQHALPSGAGDGGDGFIALDGKVAGKLRRWRRVGRRASLAARQRTTACDAFHSHVRSKPHVLMLTPASSPDGGTCPARKAGFSPALPAAPGPGTNLANL